MCPECLRTIAICKTTPSSLTSKLEEHFMFVRKYSRREDPLKCQFDDTPWMRNDPDFAVYTDQCGWAQIGLEPEQDLKKSPPEKAPEDDKA